MEKYPEVVQDALHIVRDAIDSIAFYIASRARESGLQENVKENVEENVANNFCDWKVDIIDSHRNIDSEDLSQKLQELLDCDNSDLFVTQGLASSTLEVLAQCFCRAVVKASVGLK